MRHFPHSFWLEEPLIKGKTISSIKEGQILIIGSGLAGSSLAYFLSLHGYQDLVIVDDFPEKAASFRNCGHILYGGVESPFALCQIKGEQQAKEIWKFSAASCELIKKTIAEENFSVDYQQNGYLTIALDQHELDEMKQSIAILQSWGYRAQYYHDQDLHALGFLQGLGARFDPYGAHGHPVKFRNALLQKALQNGVSYYSGCCITNLQSSSGQDKVEALLPAGQKLSFDFAILATNAYTPLIYPYIKSKSLIEPFRGQMICSKPLANTLKVQIPHSFNHGYEYALRTTDNRLMLGGWRNHVSGKETGNYQQTLNAEIDSGLKNFAQSIYSDLQDIEWQYHWSGIMGASLSGLPYIGPLPDNHRIFICAGFTGHGFAWSHGSARLLVDIMNGKTDQANLNLFAV